MAEQPKTSLATRGDAGPSGGDSRGSTPGPGDVDRVLHDPVRLALACALAAHPSLCFADIKKTVGLTDGNLGTHMARLREVGYVEAEKAGTGRAARTHYRLTRAGVRALARYRAHLEATARLLGELLPR